jgi:uncharacterized damage-inducible protein DinB
MKKHIDLIINYNYWANRRILARAATLTEAQVNEKAPYMWDSIMGTMVHVLGAEVLWRKRASEGVSPSAILKPDEFPTLDALIQRWAEEEQLMLAYLAGLGDADMERDVNYNNLAGKPLSLPLWQILSHFVNHGTQHRSEVALSLTNFDRSPGDMDIPVYIAAQSIKA